VVQESLDPNRKRPEPGRILAIILALLVHGAFLLLLVFGVNWQSKKPELVQAELWSKLPPMKVVEPNVEPQPLPPPPPPTPPPQPIPPKLEPKPEPPQPNLADIELKKRQEKARKEKIEREQRELEDKKKKDDEAKKKREAEDKKKKDDEAKQKREAEDKIKKEEEAKKLAQQMADAAAKKAAEDKARAQGEARKKVIDDWSEEIRALVRRRANVPETVTGNPVIQVRLKLLVNGVVFEGQIAKASGNRVYDEAVERAIAGIRQWPVPTDPEVFRNNREIILNIELRK